MTGDVLDVVDLNKTFGSIQALQSFNFQAKTGEIIALLGPNGAGKSTLMNMISGFLSPTSGKIMINGESIMKNPEKSKSQIGFLPEGAPIYPDMSVHMFLKYMADLRGASPQDLQDVIEKAHIKEVLSQRVETLSKGYLRRVGFAQSLLGNPKILLLDEPTDGLDPNQKEHMRRLISSMGENKIILISTHLLDEAEAVCSRIIIMAHGKIKIDGTCKEILKTTKSKSLEDAFKTLTRD